MTYLVEGGKIRYDDNCTEKTFCDIYALTVSRPFLLHYVEADLSLKYQVYMSTQILHVCKNFTEYRSHSHFGPIKIFISSQICNT